MPKKPSKPSSTNTGNPSPRKGKNLKEKNASSEDDDFSDDELDGEASNSEARTLRLELLPMSAEIVNKQYPPIKIIDDAVLKASEVILQNIAKIYDMCSRSTNDSMNNDKVKLKDFVFMLNEIEAEHVCNQLTVYTNSKWLEILARDLQDVIGIVETVSGRRKY